MKSRYKVFFDNGAGVTLCYINEELKAGLSLSFIKKEIKNMLHKGMRYSDDGLEAFDYPEKVELYYNGKNYLFTRKLKLKKEINYIMEQL